MGQKIYKIGVLLLDGFNAMAMHGFIDPFRSANYLQGQAIYEWSFLCVPSTQDSAAGGASHQVMARNQGCFSNLTPLSSEDEFDLVVVNASWAVERHQTPSLMRWLRARAARGTTLVGIDTGAFVLAYAGLLDGRRAAVHYEHIASFRELFPYVGVVEDLYVMDNDIVTSCGGVASADLALAIIRLQQGTELANASGRYIFHERLRAGEEGQLPKDKEPLGFGISRKVRDVIIIMESALEQPVSIADLAAEVNISQRQLTRLFNLHTGVTPIKYYCDVRLDRARGLVTQTQLSMLDIAVACGFTSNAQFTRSYKARFGITPSSDRIEGRVPFQFRSFPSHVVY